MSLAIGFEIRKRHDGENARRDSSRLNHKPYCIGDASRVPASDRIDQIEPEAFVDLVEEHDPVRAGPYALLNRLGQHAMAALGVFSSGQ